MSSASNPQTTYIQKNPGPNNNDQKSEEKDEEKQEILPNIPKTRKKETWFLKENSSMTDWSECEPQLCKFLNRLPIGQEDTAISGKSRIVIVKTNKGVAWQRYPSTNNVHLLLKSLTKPTPQLVQKLNYAHAITNPYAADPQRIERGIANGYPRFSEVFPGDSYTGGEGSKW